jgi:MFS family permease
MLTSRAMKGSFHPSQKEAHREGLWYEAFEGFRLIWHDALLRAVIVQAPLINFAFSGVIFTVTLSLQHHGTSASVIGLTQSAIMVGGLFGAIVAPKLQGRYSLTQLVVAITAGGALLFGVAAIFAPSPLMATPIAIPFFISPITNAALFAAMLRKTPADMRGRVNNALLQMATGLAALSPLVAGLLVAHTSPHWAMGAFALALGVSAVLAVALKGLRNAEEADQPA